ncbi:hypothetical protein SAMN05216456_2312 [Devosia crocina]|uniref:Uncharacterized protein n=1 Tax=Devosia crocina TaxID=429728 RepID=A0A1I7NN01_9HYPH|nr:hypothetical protein SAMN05216456_2312 [Devosia crocina]
MSFVHLGLPNPHLASPWEGEGPHRGRGEILTQPPAQLLPLAGRGWVGGCAPTNPFSVSAPGASS